MRHEKKTHALELANQQQNLSHPIGGSNNSSGGVNNIATTSNTTISTTTTQPTAIQKDSTIDVTANNMITTNCSSPSSASSSVSPPALLPIATSPSPPTNTAYSVQANSCLSPNPISQTSSPPHQFQAPNQLQPKINVLALSPPPPPSNTSSPCQIFETIQTPDRMVTIANGTQPSTQHFGMIDVKHLQHGNKRWRHVSSPSTLQQVDISSSSNIHVLNPSTMAGSLRANAALFPNIIVVENSPGSISCTTAPSSRNRFLIRKPDVPVDDAININTLISQQPIGNPTSDTIMISTKPEPIENEEFFQICTERSVVSNNSVLDGVTALAQQQQQIQNRGDMILSQIKEEKDEKILQQQDSFDMENELMMNDTQTLDSRIQEPPRSNDPSMMLTPLTLGQQQPLIKSDFLLKTEDDCVEPMDDIIDDEPHHSLSTQLQQQVTIKSEDDGNRDIDWLLTEMMTESQGVTTTSNVIIPQTHQVPIISPSASHFMNSSSDTSCSLKSSPGVGISAYLSSSVPVRNANVFGGPRTSHAMQCSPSVKHVITTESHPLGLSQLSQPKVGSLDNSTLLYEDHNTPGMSVTTLEQRTNYAVNPQKKLLGDLFTGTKNPVLPSIYTDSNLIVPEPKASKYHSPHQSLQMFENDFMDIDSFLKGGSDLASNTGDGKDVSESIFNM